MSDTSPEVKTPVTPEEAFPKPVDEFDKAVEDFLKETAPEEDAEGRKPENAEADLSEQAKGPAATLDSAVQGWMDKQAEAQSAKESFEHKQRELEAQIEEKVQKRFLRKLDDFRIDPRAVLKEHDLPEDSLTEITQDLLGALSDDTLTDDQRAMRELRVTLRRQQAELDSLRKEGSQKEKRSEEEKTQATQKAAADEFVQQYMGKLVAAVPGAEAEGAGYITNLLQTNPDRAQRLLRTHADRLADERIARGLKDPPELADVVAETEKFLVEIAGPFQGQKPTGQPGSKPEAARGVLSSIDNLSRSNTPEAEVDLFDEDAMFERSMRAFDREERRVDRLFNGTDD